MEKKFVRQLCVILALILVFGVPADTFAGPKSTTTSVSSKTKGYNSKTGGKVIKKNGQYVYKKSGKKVTKDLVRINKTLWYIKNGKTAKTATGTTKVNGKNYYIKEGKAYTGTSQINGKWYRYKDGRKLTGAWKSENGKWYRYKSGRKLTGTWKSENGKWYRYKDGRKLTGTWKSKEGKSYYYKNGVKLTGFKKDGSRKLYYKGGQKSSKTGIVSANGKSYYVVKGVFQSSTTGFVKYSGSFYYVKNGTVSTKATVSDDGRTYKLSSGKFTGTDVVKTVDGKYCYVNNGKDNNSKNTEVTASNGNTYSFNQKGVVTSYRDKNGKVVTISSANSTTNTGNATTTEKSTTTESPATTEKATTEKAATTEEVTTEKATTEKATTEHVHNWVLNFSWAETKWEEYSYCSHCKIDMTNMNATECKNHKDNCGQYYYDEDIGMYLYAGSKTIFSSRYVKTGHYYDYYSCSECGDNKEEYR